VSNRYVGMRKYSGIRSYSHQISSCFRQDSVDGCILFYCRSVSNADTYIRANVILNPSLCVVRVNTA
jgi:hypothetical protein